MGGVTLLLMITVVLCIVILCMRKHHRLRRELSQEYDQVLCNRRTKLSSTGEDEAMATDFDATAHQLSQ